jgi:hypothetical protein
LERNRKKRKRKRRIYIVRGGRTHPTRIDPRNLSDPSEPEPDPTWFLKKKLNWPDPNRFEIKWPSIQSKSIKNLKKNTIYKLIWPDFFQKIKLIRSVRLPPLYVVVLQFGMSNMYTCKLNWFPKLRTSLPSNQSSVARNVQQFKKAKGHQD